MTDELPRDDRPAASFGYTIGYVEDVPAALAFFEAAFGMRRRFLTPEQDYGELDTGATTLAFASAELAASNLATGGGFTPLDESTRPVGISITVVTDDVVAAVTAAIASGATPYVEPTEKPWGQTVAYVVDPNGLLIEIATPVNA